MERLAVRDVRRLLAFVACTSEGEPNDPFPPHVLGHLGELIPSDDVTYFERDLENGALLTHRRHASFEMPRSVDEVSHRLSSPVTASRLNPFGQTARLSALLPASELAKLDF
jgi:hypothetical protein